MEETERSLECFFFFHFIKVPDYWVKCLPASRISCKVLLVQMYCRILRTVFALTREIATVGTHCTVVTVFAVHLGYILSLEKVLNPVADKHFLFFCISGINMTPV